MVNFFATRAHKSAVLVACRNLEIWRLAQGDFKKAGWTDNTGNTRQNTTQRNTTNTKNKNKHGGRGRAGDWPSSKLGGRRFETRGGAGGEKHFEELFWLFEGFPPALRGGDWCVPL